MVELELLERELLIELLEREELMELLERELLVELLERELLTLEGLELETLERELLDGTLLTLDDASHTPKSVHACIHAQPTPGS